LLIDFISSSNFSEEENENLFKLLSSFSVFLHIEDNLSNKSDSVLTIAGSRKSFWINLVLKLSCERDAPFLTIFSASSQALHISN
jgi:hypothetical protein